MGDLSSRRRRRRPLTLAGRFFLIASVICLHGLIDQSILPLLAYVLSVLLVAAIAGQYFRPRIVGQMRPPSLVCLGDPLELSVTLTNRRRLPAYDVHVEPVGIPAGWQIDETEHMIASLAPGESVTLEYQATAIERGEFPLPRLRVYSTFPFNLFRRTLMLPSKGVSVIAPALDGHRLSIDEQHQGVEMTDLYGRRRASSSLEYVGSREYQPGTPVRRWDFTSWARLGAPTVCEFVEGMHRRAVLIVDLEQNPGGRNFAVLQQALTVPAPDCFEAVLSRAATICDVLARAGYEIQMFLLGEHAQLVQTADDGGARDQLLSALAKCQAASVIHTEARSEVIQQAAPMADLFAVFSRWDDARDRLVKAIADDADLVDVAVVPGDAQRGSVSLHAEEAAS